MLYLGAKKSLLSSGKTLAQQIAAMFASGEQGAWYDPSDASTRFTLQRPYLGVVASRGLVPNTKHATNTQIMSQTRHIARDSITALKLLCSNYYVLVSATVAEAAPGATMSVAASVSIDRVTWRPVLWSGLTAGTVPNGGDLLSDSTDIAIPAGTTFYVRMYKACTAGIVYCGTQGDPTSNELFRIGTSVVDSTGGGAFTGTANFFTGGPTAILGMTSRPSVLLLGDSITYGFDDAYSPSVNGDLGKFAQSIGASLGYINAARSSDEANQFLLSNTMRRTYGQYVSHVIGGCGRNDLDKGRTAAQIKADILAIAALFDRPMYWDTITPLASSSDAFATVASQTTSSSNVRRAEVNDWLRAVPSGLAGCFDTCQAIESSPNTNLGKWLPAYTTDGQHPNAVGYAAIAASGVLNPGVFTMTSAAGQFVGEITDKSGRSNTAVQATAAARPIYQPSPARIDCDGVDDAMDTTFQIALGSACTIVRSVPGVGALISTSQTIGTTYTNTTTHSGLLIINRPLTARETLTATRWGDQMAGV